MSPHVSDRESVFYSFPGTRKTIMERTGLRSYEPLNPQVVATTLFGPQYPTPRGMGAGGDSGGGEYLLGSWDSLHQDLCIV